MEKQRFLVTRRDTGRDIEELDVIPGLDSSSIVDEVMHQFEEATDQELFDGWNAGGLYVDPDTCKWIYIMVFTDGVLEEDLGRDADTLKVDDWLISKIKSQIEHGGWRGEHGILDVSPVPVGRPPEMESGRRVNVYLSSAAIEQAIKMGDGNVSQGIRFALERCKSTP